MTTFYFPAHTTNVAPSRRAPPRAACRPQSQKSQCQSPSIICTRRGHTAPRAVCSRPLRLTRGARCRHCRMRPLRLPRGARCRHFLAAPASLASRRPLPPLAFRMRPLRSSNVMQTAPEALKSPGLHCPASGRGPWWGCPRARAPRASRARRWSAPSHPRPQASRARRWSASLQKPEAPPPRRGRGLPLK